MEGVVIWKPVLTEATFVQGEEAKILTMGDMQIGAETDLERLAEYVAWGVDNGAYFLGTGDYLDVTSPSNRAALLEADSRLYDSTQRAIQDAFTGILGEAYDILKESKGRWLGMVRGHHWWPFKTGQTTDSVLAEALDAPYLGDCGICFLRLKGKSKRYVDASVWVHHGQGSGMTSGAPLNKLEHIAKTFYADIYVMGHFHRKAATALPWIEHFVEAREVVQRGKNRYLVAAGGFLKGWQLGTRDLAGLPAGNYIERKMLAPVALGGVLMMIRAKDEDGRTDVDINISI